MPQTDHAGDNPELLLPGADRPRPLPPDLRERLAEVLVMESSPRAAAGRSSTTLGHGVPGGPAPLPRGARGRLQDTLAPARSARRWRRWDVLAPCLGAAAAVIVALAVGLPALVDGPSGGSHNLNASPVIVPAAHGPSKVTHHTPMAPFRSLARSGKVRPPATTTTVAMAGPFRAVPGPGGRKELATHPALPAVAGLSPDRGPVGGGNWVVVKGRALGSATAVKFGNAKASDVTVMSASELKVRAPAHGPGVVDIIVQARAGLSTTVVSDRYTYTPAR